jgi:tetratricopeptide (TPR) repeat protein
MQLRPVACILAASFALAVFAAPASACNDAQAIMSAVTKGDWAGGLKLADSCVAEDRAASPPPGHITTGNLLTVVNVVYWELARATLNAKLRQQAPADQALQRAVQWAQQYDVDNPQGLVPIVPLTNATRGYLAEQRGDHAMAVRFYTDADVGFPGVASARLALIALDAGDEEVAQARAEATVSKDPEAPTALYVLGVLAERRNAIQAAVKYYDLAFDSIARAAQRGPSFPLHYLEQDRIAKARVAIHSR